MCLYFVQVFSHFVTLVRWKSKSSGEARKTSADGGCRRADFADAGRAQAPERETGAGMRYADTLRRRREPAGRPRLRRGEERSAGWQRQPL